ncbi:MAG: lysophospholipid acyltransferase family protein [Actinomycetes bacterium]
MAELVYPPVMAGLRTAFLALGLKLDVHGGENVPRTGGAVMASNHVSHLDFVFVGLGARPSRRLVRFMAKKAVFEHPVAGPLMRGMKHIPVDRDAGAGSYAQALRMLSDGELVGVFPEATISRSFQPKEFKTGAVRLARATRTPLIPVAVWGTQRLWTYDERSSLKQRGVPVAVWVGEPVDATGDQDEATARLRTAVTNLLVDARAHYPDDGHGQWWQPAALGGTAQAPGSSD